MSEFINPKKIISEAVVAQGSMVADFGFGGGIYFQTKKTIREVKQGYYLELDIAYDFDLQGISQNYHLVDDATEIAANTKDGSAINSSYGGVTLNNPSYGKYYKGMI